VSARIAYLVRHGRTALNVAGSLRGHADPPLDGEGRAQAQRLGKLFVGVGVDAILTSSLQRARETAAPIAETTGVHPLVVFRFADRDYGPWNGARRADVERQFGKVDAAPGVEPRERFDRRVLGAFEASAERAAEAFIVVAHEAVNRLILARVVPTLGGDPDRIPQRTGGWNRLERDGGRWAAAVVDAVPGDGREP
jgi:broad specificity phosphatase PhoE